MACFYDTKMALERTFHNVTMINRLHETFLYHLNPILQWRYQNYVACFPTMNEFLSFVKKNLVELIPLCVIMLMIGTYNSLTRHILTSAAHQGSISYECQQISTINQRLFKLFSRNDPFEHSSVYSGVYSPYKLTRIFMLRDKTI